MNELVVIFDTNINTCETLHLSDGEYFAFWGGRCVMPSPGVVLASGRCERYLYRYQVGTNDFAKSTNGQDWQPIKNLYDEYDDEYEQ